MPAMAWIECLSLEGRMQRKKKFKEKSDSLLAKVTPRVDTPIIITGRNGLSHKTTLSRLKCGLKLALDVQGLRAGTQTG